MIQKVSIYIDSITFLDDFDKKEIKQLCESIEQLSQNEINEALKKWPIIMAGIAWYTNQAGGNVETLDKIKNEHHKSIMIRSRVDGNPSWVADCHGVTDTTYSRIGDQLIEARTWHDLMIKYYTICNSQRSILEQLSNNVRFNSKIDFHQ